VQGGLWVRVWGRSSAGGEQEQSAHANTHNFVFAHRHTTRSCCDPTRWFHPSPPVLALPRHTAASGQVRLQRRARHGAAITRAVSPHPAVRCAMVRGATVRVRHGGSRRRQSTLCWHRLARSGAGAAHGVLVRVRLPGVATWSSHRADIFCNVV
jgi:hypothetical protein